MGDLDTKPGVAAQSILDKTVRWHDSFYDKTYTEIKELLDANRSNGILYIEYHYNQIGLTNEWLKNISDKIGNMLTVRREILLQRMHGSDLSPYPRESIEFIMSSKCEPIDQLFINEYFMFDIYEPLKRTIPYIVGIDCSTGTSSDNNAITILNPYTVRPVAEFKSPYIGETDYENLIETLVLEHIPRAIVCIERNHVGDSVIDHLLNKSRIANNLYFDKDKDLVEAKMREAETVESMLKAKSKLKTKYGVYTTGKSRETMFAILSRRIEENNEDFITAHIIDDIAGLIRTPSGKIEARPGGHDDNIMSYLIAMYVYTHGNNLAYFGFYKTDLYEDVEENQGIITSNRARGVLPNEVVSSMEIEEEKDRILNYEDILRTAINNAQQSSMRLYRSNIGSDNHFDNTPNGIVDEEYFEELDMDIFDRLNGF